MNQVVLVGPILADTDRVRENGVFGTIPAVAAAAPDGNTMIEKLWNSREIHEMTAKSQLNFRK